MGTDAIPLQKDTRKHMVMKGDHSTFGTGSPESRYMLSVPGRDVNGMASSKSLGEIDELGLHDTESEDGSMSEGTVVVKDDGFSESTSAEVEHLHEEVNEEEENSKKEDVKKRVLLWQMKATRNQVREEQIAAEMNRKAMPRS